MPVLAAVVSIVLGMVLFLVSGGTSDAPQWTEPAETPGKTADTTVSPAQPAESSADDGFVSIPGGTFKMGRAMENGAECIAYTTWGCVDVIAASTGQMSKRYGQIYDDVDENGNDTYDRYRKDSFYWYQNVIRTNGAEL